MENGAVAKVCKPSELFGQDLREYSLENPHIFQFAIALKAKGLTINPEGMKNVVDLAKAIKEAKTHD
jgi:hypothetical protein